MNHNLQESKNILAMFYEDLRAFIQEETKAVALNQKSTNLSI